jgi:hypothetical protein
VDELPQSGSGNCILVVVDRFTKYSHFLPLKHPYTTHSVAKLFLDQVYKLHGLPLPIATDHDRIFTSNFWSALFELVGVQPNMGSTYHPQSNDQTEHVNHCMEIFLRCFVIGCPNKWLDWLPLAEFWYNTSYHSSIGRSPFEALYGHSPRHFGVSPDAVTPVVSLNEWLQECRLMAALIKQHLNHTTVKMKNQPYKKRPEHLFVQGELVFLKLQPHVQSLLAPRANQKRPCWVSCLQVQAS